MRSFPALFFDYTKHMKTQLKLFFSIFFLSIYYNAELFANDIQTSSTSRRIQVYSVSQNFWDVKSGETLSGIMKKLLPDNPAIHDSLSQQILDLNPEAFIQSDANKLKANTRLWLPNAIPLTPTKYTRDKYTRDKYEIRSFSWGQAYKTRR